MAFTTDDFNKIWASTSPLTPYSFSESNYKQGWNFIGSTPPARQMWDYLQKNNDEKMQYLANNYLQLSGGTMTGQITSSTDVALAKNNTNRFLVLCGGTEANDGAHFYLYGKDYTNNPGSFTIKARIPPNEKKLEGKADGTLTWDGKLLSAPSGRILTSSGTVAAVNGSYTDITSVTLDKGISDKWLVIAHVGISASVDTVITFRIEGLSISTCRFSGLNGGGAITSTVIDISSNYGCAVSAHKSSTTEFNYAADMYAIPLM